MKPIYIPTKTTINNKGKIQKYIGTIEEVMGAFTYDVIASEVINGIMHYQLVQLNISLFFPYLGS